MKIKSNEVWYIDQHTDVHRRMANSLECIVVVLHGWVAVKSARQESGVGHTIH